MPKSQLKRLKASLHEQRTTKGGKIKPTPQTKRPETSAQRAHRIRQETLLPELRNRGRVGGIVDRRIGENDPTLAPEDRMLQRYAAESQRSKRTNVFNLEDEDDDAGEEELTHMGQPVRSDRGGRMIDDYQESQHGNSADEADGEMFSRSKRRLEDAVDEITRAQEDAEGHPERKKSKKEVMEEVIAKSKLHRYERQKAHEEDDDVREELDRGLPDLLAALRGGKPKEKVSSTTAGNGASGANGAALMHPDRAGLLNGAARDPNHDYDQQIQQLAMDKRAQPTQRTKTAEEKAEEEAQRLKGLEESRQRRMNGEVESNEFDGEEPDGQPTVEADLNGDAEASEDEAAGFGFQRARSTTKPITKPVLDVEDEDDFIIDEDLVGSGSDVDDQSLDESHEESVNGDLKAEAEDEDADFLQDVLPASTEERSRPTAITSITAGTSLAYTYPCPQSHDELLQVFKNVSTTDMPTVVQRIRALYHSSLAAENKVKLPAFASALVYHVAYLSMQKPRTDCLPVIESLIRHIHSMSRTYPTPIATTFRKHLETMHESINSDPTRCLTAGDLTILTAIGTIYPTSDHFHQVVTPAITIIARWLGTTLPPTPTPIPTALSLTGAYLVRLCIQYQRRARRYVPETLRFTVQALRPENNADYPTAISHIENLKNPINLWQDNIAFTEIFTPTVLPTLHRLVRTAQPSSPILPPARTLLKHLHTLLATARRTRKPLELHHHKPLPIKTALPLFSDTFHPSKHYDPDPERAESAKLRKEHKREKKGAMRELRRDAEFVGREKLREKKERDRAYEEKFRRVIGGIEREEGEGKNVYERSREKRKTRF